LHDSAWSTSATLFVLHKVSWAERARRIKEVRRKGKKVEVPPQPFSALTELIKSTLDFFLRRGS
jgi:hypothetical protein